MGWVLRLVETGTDNRARSVDVMEVSRPNDLRDLASLGLTLPVDFPPWSGGVRSERHSAARMVIPSMLARASAGVR
jgi:hypothetical protein